MSKRGGPVGAFNGNWKNWWKRRQEMRSDPLPAEHDYSRYWSVSRRSKRNPNSWIIIRFYQATKAEMAETFVRYFSDGNHRLRHIFSYGPSHDHTIAEHRVSVTSSDDE